MIGLLARLFRDARGTTTIEYGMLCGMVVLAIIAAVRGLGDQNGGIWSGVSSKSAAAMQGTGP